MRASTRVRVSAPTSAHPRTTLETVITLTLSSCAISLRRTGVVGALDMSIRAPDRAGRCSASLQKREYTNLRRGPGDGGQDPAARSTRRLAGLSILAGGG